MSNSDMGTQRTDKTNKTEKSSKKHKKKHKKHKKSKSSKKSKAIDSSSSSDWSAGDRNVDYGSHGQLTDDGDWDGRSQDLYDSDHPPDYPLNSYHL